LKALTPKQLDALRSQANQAIRTRKIETLYPSAGPLSRQGYFKHQEFFKAGAVHRERLLIAGNRTGKASRYDTPVATPHGWRAICELRVGDQVVAGDGSICNVVGVYPQGVKPFLS
jgi:hypothetical protein